MEKMPASMTLLEYDYLVSVDISLVLIPVINSNAFVDTVHNTLIGQHVARDMELRR